MRAWAACLRECACLIKMLEPRHLGPSSFLPPSPKALACLTQSRPHGNKGQSSTLSLGSEPRAVLSHSTYSYLKLSHLSPGLLLFCQISISRDKYQFHQRKSLPALFLTPLCFLSGWKSPETFCFGSERMDE